MKARGMIAAIVAGLLALIVVLPGCGGKPIVGATAQETAEGFARALEAGDLKAAAEAFDYVTEARSANPDWDDIPSGQRDLIINKLQETKATSLYSYAQKLGDDIEVASAQGGAVTLTGKTGSLHLSLRSVDGKSYIYQVW